MTDREILEKLVNKFDVLVNKFDVLELKVDTIKEKVEDFQLDTKISERNIRHDIRYLRDEMDTVIQILKMNELV